MRILYLTSNINPFDGTGTFSRGLIGAARRAGHDPVVLLPERHKVNPEIEGGIDARRVLPPQKSLIGSVFTTWLSSRRIAQKDGVQNIDLVHGLFERYAPLTRALAKRLGVPYVLSAVGSYSLECFERRTRLSGRFRRAFDEAAVVLAISRFTGDALKRHAPDCNIEVVYPGIEWPDDADARGENREKVLLSVGALKPRKGQDMLLRAFSGLSREFPDWRYVAAGNADDPDMLELMQKIITEHRLEDRVQLPGRVAQDELMNLYQRAGIFALAPRADGWKIEGYGLAFLEAAARGIPVVSTPECGFAEHLRERQIGVLATDDSVDALRASLAPLMRDAGQRRTLGLAAQAFARSRSWDAAFAPINTHYKLK